MATQTPTGRSVKDDREYCWNLGLAISAATMMPGQTRTSREIAAYVGAALEVVMGVNGISHQRIEQVEKQAMRKLRSPSRIQFFKGER